MCGNYFKASSFRRRPESQSPLQGDSGLRRNDQGIFLSWQDAAPAALNREQKLAPTGLSRAWRAPVERLASSVLRFAPRHQRGFSLVEIIIGMVITAIALTSLTALLYPQFARGVDPIFQIRAAELGQALAEEILGKAFDASTPVGGNPPCNPCSAIAGTAADADGQARTTFDDVDDYNAYCQGFFNVIDQNGTDLTAGNGIYANFRMQICVFYDDAYAGASDNNGTVAKRIRVDIFPPSAGLVQTTTPIRFVFYRSNF
jgi:MSHA pilin protein MshD